MRQYDEQQWTEVELGQWQQAKQPDEFSAAPITRPQNFVPARSPGGLSSSQHERATHMMSTVIQAAPVPISGLPRTETRVQATSNPVTSAKGFAIRFGAIATAVVVLAIFFGLLAWANASTLWGWVVFFGVAGGGLYVTGMVMNGRDYQNSPEHTNQLDIIEREKTNRMAIVEGEKTRREALRVYGQLIERG